MNSKPILLMCLLYITTILSMPTNTDHSCIIQRFIQKERQKIEDLTPRQRHRFSSDKNPTRTIQINNEILNAISRVKSIQEAREVENTIFPVNGGEESISDDEQVNRYFAHSCIQDFLFHLEKHIDAIEAGENLAENIDLAINDNDL